LSASEYTKETVLKDLGLDQMPAPRLKGLEHATPTGGSMLKWKKAVQLIDEIESCAFERFIPDALEIDQSMDPRSFNPDNSRVISIFTDIPIPMVERISRSTGITEAPTAENHYLWLALEVDRHVIELGAEACSPIKIFRLHGSDGTRPLLGAMFKLRFPSNVAREDIGANWGLLSEKARNPEVRLEDSETAPQ
jgi:hypothetical protein